MLQRLPTTPHLAMLAFAIFLALGTTAGIVSAVKRNSLVDHFIRGFALLGQYIPTF